MIEHLQIDTIGYIRCGYREKFGIPRQPGLVKSVTATVELIPPYSQPDCVRGLDECSHIWLLFIFSECVGKGWKPTVRPPRLGGNQRTGVFGCRAPFRPNPIGLSPVELLSIEQKGDRLLLHVRGADLLDGTPIVDIKPYLPYTDSIAQAEFALAPAAAQPLQLPVLFSEAAQSSCQYFSQHLQLPLAEQISEVLRCDPRPAYKKGDAERIYGLNLYDLNVRWQINEREIYILSICALDADTETSTVTSNAISETRNTGEQP
ncbi:MAG: tRNA (N6-threonylcarbamoyladenosine(37)-N6)-methyltransferase TrmO [Marinobacterium sp.]|nr:tRNA (N6-threonylcarbamoyladenosine(37)-N6)-methyltransferase TrmO [Marinobacterium sp.]